MSKTTEKVPFFRTWWFWVGGIIGIYVLIRIVANTPSEEHQSTISTSNQSITTNSQADASPAEPNPAEQQTAPTTAEATKEEKYIPGLTAADIKLNLEERLGMVFTGPEKLKSMYLDSGKATDPSTGATLTCDIYESSPTDILLVEFAVEGFSVNNAELMNALTSDYFGFVSTLPYEDAEPENARKWVEANVTKAIGQGNVSTNTIGSAKYEMYGTEQMRTLEIKPN